MKTVFIVGIMFSSSVAHAFSGKLSVKVTENSTQEKVSQNIGITMSQPLFMGLGWWSWSGIGQTFEKDLDVNHWAQSVHGLDWNFGRFTIGGTAKFQAENDFNDRSAEYGARFSVKLW